MNAWESDPEYPVTEWQAEVANGDTRRGYAEWVQWAREVAAQDQADSTPVTVNTFIDWMQDTLDDFAASFHLPTTPKENTP